MRVSAQRNWQRVGLRMRRSDGRGILRSMIAESGCSGPVMAESAERGCRRVDCARIRTELAVVKRRMLELETNFDRLVTQSVHAAVKCRDVAQATLLLKLEEQLATLQKREALAEEALAEEAVAEQALAAQPKSPTTKRKRVSWAALEVIVYAPLGRTRP